MSNTTYTRVSVTEARPGDEVFQAGKWTPVAAFHIHGSRRDLVKIVWANGGSHSMPITHAPTIRRAIPAATKTPAPFATRTNVVAHRSTRKYAQSFLDSYADVQGEQNYWTGSREVPVFVVWEIVKAAKGFDVIQTVSAR